jgi:hypothetical protein
MISEISKDRGLEDINFCSRCRRLLKLEDRGKTVVIECNAIDRFDCPQLLEKFYPRILSLPEEKRQELIARIRARKLTREDAEYFLT